MKNRRRDLTSEFTPLFSLNLRLVCDEITELIIGGELCGACCQLQRGRGGGIIFSKFHVFALCEVIYQYGARRAAWNALGRGESGMLRYRHLEHVLQYNWD